MKAGTLVLIALLGQQTTKPVFRSMSTLVSVDVSVRRGNSPVPNLTTSDFTLLDNGVPQTIEAVQIEAVPVDITLAIDVSGSTRASLDHYRADVVSIATLLRPVDRLRLIGFGTGVSEALRLQSIAGRPPVDRLLASSNSAVYDGIVAAMLRPVGLDRRHLVVVFTDGYDNRSVTAPELLGAAARRTDAVVHIVGASPRSMDARAVISAGLFWPPDSLDELAATTGGAVHEPPGGWVAETGGPLLREFRRIFDDFRQSYVLRFTPRGVKLEGWHDLTVGVTMKGKFNVRARRGYSGG